MTEIHYTKYGTKVSLEVFGHSGDGQVCSAISGIVYMLAGWIKNNETKHVYRNRIKLENGKSEIVFEGDSYALEIAEAVCIGLAQIAESFPNNAQIYITHK